MVVLIMSDTEMNRVEMILVVDTSNSGSHDGGDRDTDGRDDGAYNDDGNVECGDSGEEEEESKLEVEINDGGDDEDSSSEEVQ